MGLWCAKFEDSKFNPGQTLRHNYTTILKIGLHCFAASLGSIVQMVFAYLSQSNFFKAGKQIVAEMSQKEKQGASTMSYDDCIVMTGKPSPQALYLRGGLRNSWSSENFVRS